MKKKIKKWLRLNCLLLDHNDWIPNDVHTTFRAFFTALMSYLSSAILKTVTVSNNVAITCQQFTRNTLAYHSFQHHPTNASHEPRQHSDAFLSSAYNGRQQSASISIYHPSSPQKVQQYFHDDFLHIVTLILPLCIKKNLKTAKPSWKGKGTEK